MKILTTLQMKNLSQHGVVGQLQSHLGINYKASHITFCTIKSSVLVPICLF